jgi:hypothetical protein
MSEIDSITMSAPFSRALLVGTTKVYPGVRADIVTESIMLNDQAVKRAFAWFQPLRTSPNRFTSIESSTSSG